MTAATKAWKQKHAQQQREYMRNYYRKRMAQRGIEVGPPRRVWTDEDLERMRSLAGRLRIKEIAEAMNCSTSMVKYICRKIGASMRVPTQHGTNSMYHGRNHCRCAECKLAARTYERERRNKIRQQRPDRNQRAAARRRAKREESDARVERMMQAVERLYAMRRVAA